MLATVGVQPSEVSRIISLLKGIITQKEPIVKSIKDFIEELKEEYIGND